MNRTLVSKALSEVWSWKDECYKEVAHLSRREALRALVRNAERVSRELNLGLKQPTPSRPPSPLMVAEGKVEYRTSSDGKQKKR